MIISKAKYTHIGNRPVNEDSCQTESFENQRAYAVVADGLGGHGAGDKASQIAVEYLSQCRQCYDLPTKEQIYSWMKKSNDTIFSIRKNTTEMKSTAVFLAVFKNQAIWAHIGDSRLYYFHNGVLKYITKDHSVPQMLVNAGELTHDQIPESPDRSRILRALGNEELEPEIHKPISLQPGQNAFLLCTDGFWEYLKDNEIWLDLMKSETPEKWLKYLRCRGEMRKKGNIDNNTAIAMFVEI